MFPCSPPQNQCPSLLMLAAGCASFGGTQGKGWRLDSLAWGKKTHGHVWQSSTVSILQENCDLDLIESINKWLEKSKDGTHCNGFRDISIAGLRTRHQRIQCIINCKHEIQQGSCSLKTQNNPPYEHSVPLSNPQKINLFSHGLQMQGEIREHAPGLFSASLVEVG